MNNCVQKNFRGFSLIEILVAASVFVILLLGIYSLVVLSLKLAQDNKYYGEATSLANKKIEELHNLAYEKVGTIGGSPAGVISEKESIAISTDFLVTTTIVYYDDPYDGTLVSGDDTVFTDYKIASIDISWQGRHGQKKLVFFTKIIPRTEESPSGFGLLKISVVDANGLPISNANVSVVNKNVLPIINSNYVTNQEGLLALPLPPAVESYEVSVSKAGYSEEKTYARDLTNPNPSKPNYSIFAGQKTEDSFSIDRLSEVEIVTYASTGVDNLKISESPVNSSNDFPRTVLDSESNFYYIWQRQIGADKPGVFWQKFSVNGNKIWSSDKLITQGSNPDLKIAGDSILVAVWQNDSAGNNDTYFQFFNGQGSSLFPAKNVSHVTNGEQVNPRLAITKLGNHATTTIVWQDNRNGNWDIYAQSFGSEGGVIWDNDLLIDNNIQADSAPQIISLVEGGYLVVWLRLDEANPEKNQILLQGFNDQGDLFWNEAKAINISNSVKSNLAITEGEQDDFYIAYIDRGSIDYAMLEKFNHSGDLQWQKKINQNRSSNSVLSSSIVYSEGVIMTAWAEKSISNSDVYAQKFDESGNRLWSNDFRLNFTVNTSNQDQPFLTEAIDGRFLGAWRDDRGGTPSIYSYLFSGDYAVQPIGSIPLLVTGTKKIGENPVIYKVNQKYQTDVNGYLKIPLEWDSTGYSIKIDSGYVGAIETSEPEIPIMIRAGENIPINLTIK